MRVYELAKEHDLDAKQLVAALQSAGFEVKNTLVSADESIVGWVEEQSKSGFPTLADSGDSAKAAPKKAKTKAKSKTKAKTKAEPKEKAKATETSGTDARPSLKEAAKRLEAEAPSDTEADKKKESSAEAEPKQPPVKKRAKVKRKRKVPLGGLPQESETPAEPAPPAPIEPAPEPEPEPKAPEQEEAPAEVKPEPQAEAEEPKAKAEATETKEQAPSEDEREDKGKGKGKADKKKGQEKKPPKKAPKKTDKPKGEEIRLRPREEATAEDVESSDVVVEEETDADQHHAGTGHKRADFRGANRLAELPAMFNDTEQSYTSLTGGRGRRRRGGRRGAGARRSRRGGRRTQTVKRERDPDAVAQVAVGMTVRDLSTALGIKINDIVGWFMKNGQLVNVNDNLSEEDISLIAEEFDLKYEWKTQQDLEQELADQLTQIEDATEDEDLVMRPPVVTFLGHVDHGKTSLLDKIRTSRVAAHEAGGITQHMGAYNVDVRDQAITFLDTPGHEAFTAMRARGARLTDVAVLVVAADDGVMPQTEEACSHARNAGVPIVVAINKCDLPGANPDRVRQELSTRLELLPEEWGGQTGMVEVSAQTGQGLEELLERILLESEILELQADPTRPATGYVVEAKVSESRGVVATVLIKDGTLNRGDVVLCSAGYGKVKLLYDEHGGTIDEAGPGQPVRIVGLNNIPEAGDRIYVLDDISKARAIAEQREREARQAALSKRSHVTLENLHAHLGEGEVKELNLIIKADVKGSIEVLEKTLGDLSNDEVKLSVIHSGVGGINQADVILADASDALVVGFHVIADQSARLQASSLGVQIKVYHIIYRLIEDMRAALEGMLPPEEKEVVQGHAQVRQIFKASRVGTIAGCYVLDGVITRSSQARVIRSNVVIHDGKIDNLKRFKDDAREVRESFECGITVTGFNDFQIEDIIESYVVEEVARKLE